MDNQTQTMILQAFANDRALLLNHIQQLEKKISELEKEISEQSEKGKKRQLTSAN